MKKSEDNRFSMLHFWKTLLCYIQDSSMKKLIKYNQIHEFTTLEPSGQLSIDFKRQQVFIDN